MNPHHDLPRPKAEQPETAPNPTGTSIPAFKPLACKGLAGLAQAANAGKKGKRGNKKKPKDPAVAAHLGRVD